VTNSFVVGIDLGTSSVKAVLVDGAARVRAWAESPLPLFVPRAGWSEQNPEDWWSATIEVLRELVTNHPAEFGRVAGLALSGQMHGATFLDSGGSPLRPAILWNDGRSIAECREITRLVGFEQLLHTVGNPALEGFTAPKLLWVRRHEPEIFSRTASVLLPKDFVNMRLTGVYSTEPSDASGTLLFDISRGIWSEEVLTALDLDARLLPSLRGSSEVVGHLTGPAAAATGLAKGLPVTSGGADNACAALAAGVVAPGTILVSIGTSGTVLSPELRPAVEPLGRLHTFCHVLDGCWYGMGVVLSAGGSLRWFRDVVMAGATYEAIAREASSAPAGSDGLVFLPYLSGERTPHADAQARGVFFGLSLGHGRAHLSRAVLEGITFALRDSLDLLRETGLRAAVVRATGGGAASAFWMQLLADVFNLPVAAMPAEGGPAYGAALLAGRGVGLFPRLEELAPAAAGMPPVVSPDPARAEIYDRLYRRYRSLYPALADRFKDAEAVGP